MTVRVERICHDGLSKHVWGFGFSSGYEGGVKITLTSYQIERRASTRHKFKCIGAQERWLAMDERAYMSGLSRPKTIPEFVMDEAKSAITFEFYIGWPMPECRMP